MNDKINNEFNFRNKMNAMHDDHYDLFKKPETVCLYKKYVPTKDAHDYVVEYFKFEAYLKSGFKSPFITKNPYEGEFADFVKGLEERYSYLPKTEADIRVYAEIEAKYRIAMGK